MTNTEGVTSAMRLCGVLKPLLGHYFGVPARFGSVKMLS